MWKGSIMSSETNMKLPEEKLEHLCSYKLHNMEWVLASHFESKQEHKKFEGCMMTYGQGLWSATILMGLLDHRYLWKLNKFQGETPLQ